MSGSGIHSAPCATCCAGTRSPRPTRWFGEEPGFSAAFEVKETKEAFIFKADLPGIKAEDLDVVLTQNRLTIRGKREAEKSEKGETFYTFERSYGSFARSFTLPEGVDSKRSTPI